MTRGMVSDPAPLGGCPGAPPLPFPSGLAGSRTHVDIQRKVEGDRKHRFGVDANSRAWQTCSASTRVYHGTPRSGGAGRARGTRSCVCAPVRDPAGASQCPQPRHGPRRNPARWTLGSCLWRAGKEVGTGTEASFQMDRLSEGAVQGGLAQPRGNEASGARRGSAGRPGSGWPAGSRWGRPWPPAWPLCVPGPEVILPAGRIGWCF